MAFQRQIRFLMKKINIMKKEQSALDLMAVIR